MVQDASAPFVEVGRVIRPQGLEGELKLEFEFNNPEAFQQIVLIYMRNERGDFFPSRVTERRVEGKGNQLTFFVHLEHVADRTSAEALKHKALFLEPELAQEFLAEEEDNSYIDFDVYDQDHEHVGIVTDLMESPAQLTLVVASPEFGTLLIPFVDEYVTSVDEESESIYCQNLNLLSDL